MFLMWGSLWTKRWIPLGIRLDRRIKGVAAVVFDDDIYDLHAVGGIDLFDLLNLAGNTGVNRTT